MALGYDACGSQRVSMVAQAYCCRSKTPDPEFLSRIESAYSIRSLRQNLAVWDWGSLSVLVWSQTKEANCGSSRRAPTAPFLRSPYPSAGNSRLSRRTRMSEFGRCCRKSRKSNDAKNLANGDFWTFPPLRCSVVPLGRSVVVFLIRDVVPHVAAHETRQEL